MTYFVDQLEIFDLSKLLKDIKHLTKVLSDIKMRWSSSCIRPSLGCQWSQKVSGGTLKENQKNQKPDLDHLLLIPIFFILLVFATVKSHAEESATATAIQVNAVQTSAAEIQVPKAINKKLQMTAAVEYSSNLMANSNPDKKDSTTLIVKPGYNFSEKTNLAGRIDLIQNYDSEKRTKTSNTAVVFQPTIIELSKELNFMPDIAVALGTDAQMKHDESYRGTLSIRPTFNYAPEKIKGLTLSNGIFLNRLFHEYEVKRDFSANNEYTIRNRFIIFYAFNDDWSLELTNDYVRGWTYKGYANDAFYFTQELSYQFIKNWNAYVSHKNEGSARGPNNNGDNVDIASQKTSYVSLGLAHIF
jgi:hypothetical protein